VRSSLVIRLILALASLGLAVYLMIPTFIYFSLNEEQLREVRRDKGAFAKYLPSFVPHSHIVAGLDMAGGIHLVLGVDVDQALNSRMSRITDRLREYAVAQNMPFEKLNFVSQANEIGQIKVEFAELGQVTEFRKKALDQFRELVVESESQKKLELQLDPNLVQAAKKDSIDQTVNTIMAMKLEK
jgi:preprotein translocase subunit SecD